MRKLARSLIRETLSRRPGEPYEPNDRKIIILRPDHLGDLLFVRPALKRLRMQLPDWHLTLIVGEWSRPIVEHDEHIDEIVTFSFPGFTRTQQTNPVEPYRQLFEFANIMRVHRPAAVIVLRDDHWWGAIAAQRSGVSIIVGSDRPEMRGLLTDEVAVSGLHSVAKNTAIVDAAARRLGASLELPRADFDNAPLSWEVFDGERQFARQLLAANAITDRLVVIHPGSGAPVKLWPAERWARVAEQLAGAGFNIMLTGSESEWPMLRRIEVAAKTTCALGGKTTIRELAAIFEQADAVVGVDSGPLHLAVAVGAATVHLFGPSEIATYGPWGDPAHHQVVKSPMTCPKCGNLSKSREAGCGCMLSITCDQVVDALDSLVVH